VVPAAPHAGLSTNWRIHPRRLTDNRCVAFSTVLVVEDDVDIQRLVRILLERGGYAVRGAGDGHEALRLLFSERPDLVMLDIGLPGMDGWQVLERIRDVSDVPVLMLTAQGDELDKVRGLRSGADDFVTKPFGREELVARVDALLRRRARTAESGPEADVYIDSALTVDHTQRLAQAGDVELRLTPLEFRLLAVLVRNAGQLLSGQQLVELVWGDHFASSDQVKLTVGRLRRKLAGHIEPDPIETVRGFGYRYRRPA
jgi:DNA-binding response OmpR family regulator